MGQQGRHDVGLACLNGHEIDDSSRSSPEFNTRFCQECGEPTIDACPGCESSIRGLYDGGGYAGGWAVPKCCHNCGQPYPWTTRRMESLAATIDELDELNEDERNKLKGSIPDVSQETTMTGTTIARFKKALGKAGTIGEKALTDTLSKVATQIVLGNLGIG